MGNVLELNTCFNRVENLHLVVHGQEKSTLCHGKTRNYLGDKNILATFQAHYFNHFDNLHVIKK